MSSTNPACPDIDGLCRPTHDETARQRFVSVLRNHTKTHMRGTLKKFHEDVVQPAYERVHGKKPTSGEEVERIMRTNSYYRFYSCLRYNAQEMMFLSALDPVERALPSMIELFRSISKSPPAGGTVTLDRNLRIPDYLLAMDIHLAPGGFHSEYLEDDIAQGAMLAMGGKVSTGANIHRRSDTGAVGRSIGTWLARKYPEFKPRRMLDLGTQSGKNLLPYLDVFPGVEAYGVDVGAPSLRYGHCRAEHLGKTIHFSQQNAECMNFEDGYFDLIVSSFFLHELPVTATRRILKECYRLLAPGGIVAHMELPPQSACDAWLNWYWDWDDRYNNEPFYCEFRAQEPTKLLVEAGFASASEISTTAPSYNATPEVYERVLAGEQEAPLHGQGGWYFFGAIK